MAEESSVTLSLDDSADLSDEVTSIQTHLSLTSSGSATVSLLNRNNQLSPDNNDLRGKIAYLKITRDLTEYDLFRGRIKSQLPVYDLDGRQGVSLRLLTVGESVSDKPVTTEKVSKSGADLMAYLLETYGGIPSSFVNVAVDNSEFFENVFISEDSLGTAIRKVAEACDVELFTGPDGVITTATKKDHNSAVDVIVPKEDAVSSFSLDHGERRLPSVVRVRGRYFSEREETLEQVVSVQTIKVVALSTTKALARVTPTKDITEIQKRMAEVTITSGADSGKVVGILFNGDLEIIFTGTFDMNDFNSIRFYVEVPPKDVENEIEHPTIETIGVGSSELTRSSLYNSFSPDSNLYQRFQVGHQRLRHSNEPTLNRIESVVENTDLVSLVGVRFDEVDNPYIQDETAATNIGVRFLLEKVFASQAVRFSGVWRPNLNTLNKVISVPHFGTCLLVDLKVNYINTDAKVETISTYGCVRLRNEV